MLEEFDLDVRRSALQKSYEKLKQKFETLRLQTFIGLMHHSGLCVDSKSRDYDIETGRFRGFFKGFKVSCNPDNYTSAIQNYFAGSCHNIFQELSLDQEKLVEPFKDLEAYYAQTLTLLSDRNKTLCEEFGQQLISFRADMLRLQTDIAYILRRNLIDEIEAGGQITLDSITSGKNLLPEISETEEQDDNEKAGGSICLPTKK